jgi:hypothetical protein
MAHSVSRGLFLALVAVSVVMGTGVAQNGDLSSRRSENPAPADHGLSLILSQSQTSEPSDSGALKTCLADHPPLACVLLTITVENKGRETVLRWTTSCGADASFDLKKSDDSWAASTYSDLPICSRNVLNVQRLSPGKSYVEHIRLADSYYTSTAFPPPDDKFLHPHHQGFEFLMAPGPHIIRARWYVDGCIASGKREPGDALEPFSARSLCVAGSEPKQLFIVLQSNELNLSVPP